MVTEDKQMKLLNIEVTGYKNLKDGFNLNLMSKAKVNDIDLSDEVILVAENLYVNTNYIFTGKNASGKTTLLSLVRIIFKMFSEGILFYDEFAFNNKAINLVCHFYANGFIYKYMGTLEKPSVIIPSEPNYILFSNETLARKKYFKSYGKNIFNLDYDTFLKRSDGQKFSILQNSNFKVNRQVVFSTAKNSELDIAFKLFSQNTIKQETINAIVHLFDNSIDSLVYCETKKEFAMCRNGLVLKYHESDIKRVLSEGTIKGIVMFAYALFVLTLGSVLIIDEIENSFHKNLIEHLVMLFNDKRINTKGAQLYFSTHYAEVLNVVRRSDGVFILQNTGTIDIENLYSDYPFRSEILKSSIINNNEVNTLVNYEDIMKVKRALISEISNHD